MNTFSNQFELAKRAVNKNIYVKLSNGYFAPMSKKGLNQIYKSMASNNRKFEGLIHGEGMAFIQIELT